MTLRVGVDLGGTKIEGIVLAENGETRARRRIPAPRDSHPETLRAIRDLIQALEAEAGTGGTVGIGTPGSLSSETGLLRNSNSVWLNGHPLDRDLEEALGRRVRIANDANCFALSEARDGSGEGGRVVFGVILGTGTGGGVVVDGKVLQGANRVAGEWGHNPLPWPRDDERPGASCYCGKRGCIETFLSGPGLARAYFESTGSRLEADQVEGAKDSALVLQRYADRLAKSLATVVNILDPDVIVLGGGLSNLSLLYEEVPRLWGSYVFSDRVTTPIRKALHGDASGVRGAAWLWEEAPPVARRG